MLIIFFGPKKHIPGIIRGSHGSVCNACVRAFNVKQRTVQAPSS